MKTADYEFELPEDLIALRPADRRDSSRLMVVHREGRIEHRNFFDLPDYLDEGDMLLLNNTSVFPARFTGTKPNGGKLEILLVKELHPGTWEILSRGKYTGPVRIGRDLSAEITRGMTARFASRDDLKDILRQLGKMPLPPYIRRDPDEEDRERYQTVYAEAEGSIAAPTAGLHFSKELLDRIAAKAVLVRALTLHVGPGTFRPVKTEDPDEHRMDPEFFEISTRLIAEIGKVKRDGKRLVAVGTTATRAIEGYTSGRCALSTENGTIRGSTDIFIREGYRPAAVDVLLTNFHLPRSTPLMLASVFSGREKLLKAYEEAIALKYRFFSYGDAMLVL